MAGSNQWVMGQADQRFALLENDEGKKVLCIERLRAPRRMNDGDPTTYLTTDEQWHAIIDDIAMAPEVLACLHEVKYDLDNHGRVRVSTMTLVNETILRAEPKRKVKVQVTVEVEVEGEKQGEEWMAAVERVRDRLDCEVICSKVVG